MLCVFTGETVTRLMTCSAFMNKHWISCFALIMYMYTFVIGHMRHPGPMGPRDPRFGHRGPPLGHMRPPPRMGLPIPPPLGPMQPRQDMMMPPMPYPQQPIPQAQPGTTR